MEVKVYQLTDDAFDKVSYAYAGWERAKNSFNINDYEVVYENDYDMLNGDINENKMEILEMLFEIFNVRRPEDFKGHSLSTSDVVSLDGELFYCDSFGWKEIK